MAQENGRKILDVTHISSRGSSYRITLPKKVAAELNLSNEDDIIIFYQEELGRITLEKLRH
ncbi:MAG: AbrB/MazE/SpoVT family DNA-binding domain-containing protein [Candidatus Thermoplasmatota archaeon]|nr:AbrB/MazE/SpoVT family DNA-binding domain-containing protein [Candidatus Thermoplasmatota archaeon]MCL5955483.1 AbrB/MazE/SpoVT family DNA-binding domain-containing protein [Candidatus Thermoplasmatota archaeon]